MNILDCSEKEIDKIKNQFISDGLIIEKSRITKYDEKFFETVTLTNFVVKFFIFFSLGLYILFNVFCIALSIYYETFNIVSVIAPLIVCVAVFIISFAIFGNINTNKKVDKNVLYVIGDNFVFNFNNGIVETPKLFYSLPYDSVTKIEFIINRLRKSQLLGSVTFSFLVSDYEVTHTIQNTNLSQIGQALKTKFPSLLENLIVDGRSKDDVIIVKNNKGKYLGISFGLTAVAILMLTLPRVFDVDLVSLAVFGAIFLITALVVFLSPYLYSCHWVRGALISLVFMSAGYLPPLIFIEMSDMPILQYLAEGNLILLPTFFGNIGLCLYASVLLQTIGKIVYKLKSKSRKV